MALWVGFTLMAAFTQTIRFMLQKTLKTGTLSTAGATFARFIYSAPLVAVGAMTYARLSGQGLPHVPARFWGYALSGGLSQILATMCVVALFARRNFAVGVTFKKTEVLLTAIAGIVILGEGIAPLGWVALSVGMVAVLMLSQTPDAVGSFVQRMFTPSAGLGLASGVFFAISAVGYRGASLSLGHGDVILRASVTLALVTASQSIAMALWMRWREPGQISAVFRAWRVAGLVGLTSMVGSFCWFSAFTLQNAAYVNAVGQAELMFSLAASVLFFRERITRREALGIALLLVSILMLILVL